MQWSASVHCGRDFSPHTVIFQCASMNSSALRGHIQLLVTTNDANSLFLFRLRVTDTNTILFTKNFGLLQPQANEDGGGLGSSRNGSQVRATSSESPANQGSPKAVGPLQVTLHENGSGMRQLSEVVFATAKRELAPRVELGKIRLQLMLLRTSEERAEAVRCIQAKEWQGLNRLFAAAEGQPGAVQTFNLSCEVDPVVGTAVNGSSSSIFSSRGVSVAPPEAVSLSQVSRGSAAAVDGVDSSLNTPRSASSSAGGSAHHAIAAFMFGAGALVGATAALVFGRYAQNNK